MVSIATICSHSALQIFHGARQEGFGTIGVAKKSVKKTYGSFPLAAPDEYVIVDDYYRLLHPSVQRGLIKKNAVLIPHGSFVEYIGSENILSKLKVPLFGNRKSLKWESSRSKQEEWLKKSKVRFPKTIDFEDIAGRVFVKFGGAKGGKGFFSVSSRTEFLEECVKRNVDSKTAAIQEFLVGSRYYLHFFHSPMQRRLEFLGADKRIEIIDEAYRGLPKINEDFFDYTVTGNAPVVLRESLLPQAIDMGERVLEASKKLFKPGLIGPFCLETMLTKNGFVCFEISARIVAGTNLYPQGSPYSPYIFEEPMSTGRRIAVELAEAEREGKLEKVLS
ncbi:MAG: formate--phosphoribosylaminoimidazolecarboxamide ligase [Candidatus Aenigmarchaeota archaeon]|nr:formate--phosphoribosylaminoimidazolecarboxamide ligase [Candidatus Aenigmarchaeota archaeon]